MEILRPQKTTLLSILLTTLMMLLIPGNIYALQPQQIEPILDPTQEPKAYILVDAKSGNILKSKKHDVAINVASTGKLVTALAAISTIDKNQEIEVPPEAQAVQPMKIGLTVGEKWKRDDLLYALLMTSANDAAYALATSASGSIKEFEIEQKRIASELEMKHSSFGDPSGLDDSLAINGETKMSPYDLAIAARAVLANPELSKIVSSSSYQFVGGDDKPHTLTNHNNKFLSGFEGANGMKTGFTRKSGRTLVASASRGENTLIVAIFDIYQTDAWAASLLEEGFDMLENNRVPNNVETLPAIGVIGSKANVTILNEPADFSSQEIAAPENVVSQKNGGNILSVELVSLVIILLLAAAFVLRRRAIKKRKKLRKMRAMQMREMQRRSMIDVIDTNIDSNAEVIKR